MSVLPKHHEFWGRQSECIPVCNTKHVSRQVLVSFKGAVIWEGSVLARLDVLQEALGLSNRKILVVDSSNQCY